MIFVNQRIFVVIAGGDAQSKYLQWWLCCSYQAALSCWCFSWGQLGCRGLVHHGCPMALWAAPSGLSCRTSWKPLCLVVRARCSLSFHRSQTATLQVLQGAVPPAPSHRGGTYACVHIGSLEAQDCMPQPDVSQTFPGSPWANLWEPLLQIVCCTWRISYFRNILLNLTKLQLYQEVWFAP